MMPNGTEQEYDHYSQPDSVTTRRVDRLEYQITVIAEQLQEIKSSLAMQTIEGKQGVPESEHIIGLLEKILDAVERPNL